MTLSDIQIMLQALSSCALTGGLIYTSLQFRKSRAAAHFANFSKLVELQMHLREMRVDDPKLASVYRHDIENLSAGPDGERRVREYFFNLMQLSVFEIVWYGYTHQQLPEDYFRSWESRMRDIAGEPSFRTMWERQTMKIMHDDFQKYMSTLVSSVPMRTHEAA